MFIIRNGTERVPFRNAKIEERERKFEEPDGTGTQNEIGFPGTRERERKSKKERVPVYPDQDDGHRKITSLFLIILTIFIQIENILEFKYARCLLS